MILSVIQADATPVIGGIAALYTALFTIGAALLYPLGLLALGWPMYQLTGNFSTGLYAVSLISKTVVAVQGIRTFVPPFLSNVVVLVLISGSIFLANLLNGLARPLVDLIIDGGDFAASVTNLRAPLS